MRKIKGKWLGLAISVLLLCLLMYTRFVNLGWGLPYPFHPDERNMAVALQGLRCDELRIMNYESWKNCMNPHFFAYGQFPLYLGYIIVQLLHFLIGIMGMPISFEEATIALRIISALSSVLTALMGVKIIGFMIQIRPRHSEGVKRPRNLGRRPHALLDFSHSFEMTIATIFLIFSPVLIQSAHFGTTESLLMLLYSASIYISLLYLRNKIPNFHFILLNSLFCGLAIATKVSSIIFAVVPVGAIILEILQDYLMSFPRRRESKKARSPIRSGMTLISLFIFTAVIAILFSPHNIISWKDFVGSIQYERDVGLGTYVAFYTKQFVDTTPFVFQITNIFPYALGLPVFLLFITGFLFLPWKKEYNFLRIAWLVYFIPSAIIFAKWTRFMAPIFPLMIVFAILELFVILNKAKDLLRMQVLKQVERFLVPLGMTLLLVVIMLPGIAYLSIYQHEDTRLQASEWIYKNIPANAYILSETANVVDIPIPDSSFQNQIKPYNLISFDFYNIDENPLLPIELQSHLQQADYIFVPSRRIFANHTCVERGTYNAKRCEKLKGRYPLLNKYYEDLFSGKLGFKKVAEFSSYPVLHITDYTFQFPDEFAEETWSVFDHPVVRIYKRI